MSKNIFENFNWNEYYSLLKTALEDEIHLVHNQCGTKGGFSFAWQRLVTFKKAKMIAVSVAFCSPKDQFARKIGAFHALDNFINKGETVMLPVGSDDAAEIVLRLRDVFETAYLCQKY